MNDRIKGVLLGMASLALGLALSACGTDVQDCTDWAQAEGASVSDAAWVCGMHDAYGYTTTDITQDEYEANSRGFIRDMQDLGRKASQLGGLGHGP